MISHSFRACGEESIPVITSSASTKSDCLDISIYSKPEDRAMAVEFFELYNITVCPAVTPSPAISTESPVTSPPPCIDVSIFPVNEQPGAVVFLSLYGILACPLTNSSSATGGSTSESCVDISRFTEEQRAVIVEIIKPSVPCNETLKSTTDSPELSGSEKICINISSVDSILQKMAGGFMLSHGLVPCEQSSNTANASCIDINKYTNLEDRAKTIEFFQSYNITICPEIASTKAAYTESLLTVSSPCIDISIFPIGEQPGAVVFLSLYGIQACPLGTSSSGNGGASSTDCFDTSGFTEEQKAIIVKIIKPRVTCNETIDQVNSTCVNVSSLNDFKRMLVKAFIISYGFFSCETDADATSIVPSATLGACTDISGYTDQTERARAVEFFTLYNITICPEVPSLSTPQSQVFKASTDNPVTRSPPCVDVSIFSENERSGAVIFLSIYGILACPIESAGSGVEGRNATNCIDISGFSFEQKIIVSEAIKPTPICTETSQSSPTEVSQTGSPSESGDVYCFNISAVEESKRQLARDFMLSRGLNECQLESATLFTTETASLEEIRGTTSTCVSVSEYSDPEEKARAIQYLNLYNIRVCPESIVSPTVVETSTQDGVTTPQSQGNSFGITSESSGCIDLSGFTDPEERARAIAFFELYNYQFCPESTSTTAPSAATVSTSTAANGPSSDPSSDASGNSSSAITPVSEPCLDVSIFPENERSNAVVFLSIYGIIACPLTNSTSTEENCIDLSGFTEVRRAVITELIKPAEPCNDTSSASLDQAGSVETNPSGSSIGYEGTQTNSAGQIGEVITTGVPCVNISSYEIQERAAAVEFFKQYGISPCEDITTIVAATTTDCVDLSGVVPALREFVLALNAPLEACEDNEGKLFMLSY